ncbi:MAG: endolytic transglycosylase MltG [Rhizomicrobium sp.]
MAQARRRASYATQAQALTLASIVEKETALPAERRHIAGVFVNRLRAGMKLQSDPTIIYGITKGYPLGRGIRESELTRATPYNTYVVDGLPPGPICNPGKDSIAAVLDPAVTADVYFVADGTGGHVFSATIAEQNRHVAELRLRERIANWPRRFPRRPSRISEPLRRTDPGLSFRHDHCQHDPDSPKRMAASTARAGAGRSRASTAAAWTCACAPRRLRRARAGGAHPGGRALQARLVPGGAELRHRGERARPQGRSRRPGRRHPHRQGSRRRKPA